MNKYDPLGLALRTKADITKRLQRDAPGLKHESRDGYHYYTHPHFGRDMPLRREIVRSLLSSSHVFTLRGDSTKDVRASLEAHIAARTEIINVTGRKKYGFGADVDFVQASHGKLHEKIDWRKDPGHFFSLINNPYTDIACYWATKLTYAVGQGGWTVGVRKGSRKDFVPGDWAYIDNMRDEKDPDNWEPGFEGENVIYTGRYMFWGHITQQQTRSTLKGWCDRIRSWRSIDKKHRGEPVLLERVFYPITGLDEIESQLEP